MSAQNTQLSELSLEALQPGMEVTGIETFGDFDILATRIGQLLLTSPDLDTEECRVIDPAFSILRPNMRDHKDMTLSARFSRMVSVVDGDVHDPSAVITEPTQPGNIFHIPGLSRNFVVNVSINDLIASLEVQVFLSKTTHAGEQPRIRAHRYAPHPYKLVRSRDEYESWLKYTLLNDFRSQDSRAS